MNKLLSYCGLTDARMRASEKDLPVCPRVRPGLRLCCRFYCCDEWAHQNTIGGQGNTDKVSEKK